MYALNQDAKMLKDDLYSKKISDLMEYNPFNAGSLLFSASGFASGEKLETFLKSKLKNNSFAHTKIPFVAVATEIETGKIKNFSSGTMWPAVKASAAAIPYYPPVIINEKKYIDGAVISPVPVNTAKEYAPELIIAVNINETVTEKETNTTSDMMFRALNLAFNNLASKEQVQADIIIEPKLENIGLWDDSKNKELYEAGKEAALKAVEYIKYRLSLSN
jgi:NTE family protein